MGTASYCMVLAEWLEAARLAGVAGDCSGPGRRRVAVVLASWKTRGRRGSWPAGHLLVPGSG